MGGEKVFYLKGRLQRVKRADTAIAAVHVGSRSDGQLKCCEARIEHNPSPIFNSLSQSAPGRGRLPAAANCKRWVALRAVLLHHAAHRLATARAFSV